MSLIQRVRNILLEPKATWPVIEQEPADAASLYRGYLLYLAAIPAVAGFIGLSFVGVGAGMRFPLSAGFAQMVVSYALSLLTVFVLGLLIDALAPTFGASRNPLNALKLAAYGSTAALVGGVFNLIPALAVLGLLAALYSVYLLYTGLPVLMKCPAGKAGVYAAAVVGAGIAVSIVLGMIAGLLLPSPMMMDGMPGMGTGS